MKTALKLLLSLALTVALSITTAAGLSCITCANPNDSNCAAAGVLTCTNGETQCASAIIIVTTSGSSSTRKIMGCADSKICPATGTQDFSLDVGSSDVLARARCCNTDNCNTVFPSTPTPPAAGSLQCYSCDPVTQSCNTILTCNTQESSCFSSTVIPPGSSTSVSAHGCASGNLCLAAASLSTSPLLTSIGSIQGTATCCTTANCNILPTTTTTTATTTTTTTTTTSSAVSLVRMSLLHSLLGLVLMLLF